MPMRTVEMPPDPEPEIEPEEDFEKETPTVKKESEIEEPEPEVKTQQREAEKALKELHERLGIKDDDILSALVLRTRDRHPVRAFQIYAGTARNPSACDPNLNHYLAVTPMREVSSGRGTVGDLDRSVALWLDLDIKEGSFKDKETLLEFIDYFSKDIGQRPVGVIFSGGGYQPIWALTGEGRSDAARMTALADSFYVRCSQIAKGLGVSGVDNTNDLARVLRMPGTWNQKYPDKPMATLTIDPGEALDVGELGTHLARFVKPKKRKKRAKRKKRTARDTPIPAEWGSSDGTTGDIVGDALRFGALPVEAILPDDFEVFDTDRNGRTHFLRPGAESAQSGNVWDGITAVFSGTLNWNKDNGDKVGLTAMDVIASHSFGHDYKGACDALEEVAQEFEETGELPAGSPFARFPPEVLFEVHKRREESKKEYHMTSLEDDPEYFIGQLPPDGAMPAGVKGTLIGDLAEEFERKWGIPPLLTVAVALGIVATATHGNYEVALTTSARFPMTLYVLPMLHAGQMKSPVLSALKEVLMERQKETLKTDRPRKSAARSLLDAEKSALKKAQNDLAKEMIKEGGGDSSKLTDRITSLTEGIARKESAIQGKDWILDGGDATVEALIKRAAANGGYFAVLSAEAGSLETLAGGYNSDSKTEFIAHAYDGEAYNGARVGDAQREMDRAVGTLLLAVQPDVINTMLNNDKIKKRGLLARFLIFDIPRHPYRTRYEMSDIDTDLLMRWYRAIYDIWTRSEERRTVLVDSEILRDAEKSLIKPKADEASEEGTGVYSDWLSKIAMTGARIAALFEIVEDSESERAGNVASHASTGVVASAIDHAEHALQGGPEASTHSPRFKSLKVLIKMGKAEFSTRDLQQRVKRQTSWYRGTDDVREVLRDLKSMGWITKGGREDAWILRPDANAHFEAMVEGLSS